LYKEREISEQEISGLKSKLSFVRKIKHPEKVAETRLLFIEFREDQISGELSTLHEEISQLKARIKELVNKKFPIDKAGQTQFFGSRNPPGHFYEKVGNDFL
jgi:hypothetical protein